MATIMTMSVFYGLLLLMANISLTEEEMQGDVDVSKPPNTSQHIIFSSLVEPPFLMNTTSPGGVPTYSGFIPDLIHIIAQRLHRSYHLRLVAYAGYGVPDDDVDGGWTGIIGDVITGKADIGAAPLTMTSTRQRVVRFVTPFLEAGMVAVYRSDVWPVIQSPLDFCCQSVELIYITGSLTQYFLESESSRKSPIGYVLKQMLAGPRYPVWTRQQGVQRVLQSNGSSVFLVEKAFGEYLVATDESCRLRVTKEYLNPRFYAFAVSKSNSVLLRELNTVVESLHREGVIRWIYKQWWSGKCPLPWEYKESAKLDTSISAQDQLSQMGNSTVIPDSQIMFSSTGSTEYVIGHLMCLVLLSIASINWT